MAATTITRATVTDDSGGGTDGTIINSAWVGTAIYDAIDAIFNSKNPITYEKSVDGSYGLTVTNTSSNAAAFAGTTWLNDAATGGSAYVTSSAFGTTGVNAPSRTVFTGSGSGGAALAAQHASGAVSIYSGGTTLRAAWIPAGHLVLEELSANPTTPFLAADAAVAVYTKADKFIIGYNDGGVMTYISIPLDGSTTTWTHSTSAP